MSFAAKQEVGVIIAFIFVVIIGIIWICLKLMYYHQSQYICLHLPIAKEKLFRGIEAIEAQEQEKIDREKAKELERSY